MRWVIFLTIAGLAAFLLAPMALEAGRTLKNSAKKMWNNEDHEDEPS